MFSCIGQLYNPCYKKFVRAVAQSGSALAWGARGRGFESRQPDHYRVHIMNIHLVYTACETFEECKSIARTLLEKKIAVCVNFLPQISVMYPWQGEIAQAQEFPMLIKTTDTHIEFVTGIIRAMHSYQVPGILSWQTSSLNPDYSAWAQENLSNDTD